MKILIYGDGYFGADMAWGFEELGHDVRLLGAAKTVEQLEVLLSGNDDASFLMTLGSPAFFKEPVLKYLAGRPRAAMKYIHWDTDGITWSQIEMAHINQFGPDTVFTVCPDMLELLRSNNIRSEMLYYAYCPLFHHPADPAPPINGQISFVGNAYTNVLNKYPGHYRHISMNVLFKPLLENGTRIDFYGDTPIRQVIKTLYNFDVPAEWIHGTCPYNKIYQIYSGSFINLITQNHEYTITKRLFEVLGSGGFALSYDNTAVRRFFVPDKEVVVTSSPQQTLELVNYYSNNPDIYNEIRKAGALAVLNHTYKQRAAEILQKLQL